MSLPTPSGCRNTNRLGVHHAQAAIIDHRVCSYKHVLKTLMEKRVDSETLPAIAHAALETVRPSFFADVETGWLSHHLEQQPRLCAPAERRRHSSRSASVSAASTLAGVRSESRSATPSYTPLSSSRSSRPSTADGLAARPGAYALRLQEPPLLSDDESVKTSTPGTPSSAVTTSAAAALRDVAFNQQVCSIVLRALVAVGIVRRADKQWTEMTAQQLAQKLSSARLHAADWSADDPVVAEAIRFAGAIGASDDAAARQLVATVLSLSGTGAAGHKSAVESRQRFFRLCRRPSKHQTIPEAESLPLRTACRALPSATTASVDAESVELNAWCEYIRACRSSAIVPHPAVTAQSSTAWQLQRRARCAELLAAKACMPRPKRLRRTHSHASRCAAYSLLPKSAWLALCALACMIVGRR